jgi:hypothetical protein
VSEYPVGDAFDAALEKDGDCGSRVRKFDSEIVDENQVVFLAFSLETVALNPVIGKHPKVRKLTTCCQPAFSLHLVGFDAHI